MPPPGEHGQRSRHVPKVDHAQTGGRWLGHGSARAARAASDHRRPHHSGGQTLQAQGAEEGRLPAWLSPRPTYCGCRGQGRREACRWRLAASQRVRRAARPQVRIRHQRPRNRRVRLHHGRGDEARRLPGAHRPLATLLSGHRHRHAGDRGAPADALLFERRHARASLLPDHRHQPCRRGNPCRSAAAASHDGHRHRQDDNRISDLLDTLVLTLEPEGRAPSTQDIVPRRPQRPSR